MENFNYRYHLEADDQEWSKVVAVAAMIKARLMPNTNIQVNGIRPEWGLWMNRNLGYILTDMDRYIPEFLKSWMIRDYEGNIPAEIGEVAYIRDILLQFELERPIHQLIFGVRAADSYPFFNAHLYYPNIGKVKPVLDKTIFSRPVKELA